ncbi:MAG TPA: acyltransferase [Chitinophagaceae bacterium]|nr:acyltransferase [Chitinophagaceae bacterium]
MQTEKLEIKNRIFFPNLNGLRFVSFLVVFAYHAYLSFFIHMKDTNPEGYGVLKFLFQNGYLGVNFFFVLSGFLITYLLIKEKETTTTVHVGNFYMRRILRIWPLFFLCIFIGFSLHPMLKNFFGEVAPEPAHSIYYYFFAANFDYIHIFPLRPNGIVLPVLWSVCVEEQFYLTWPLIFWLVPLRKLKYVFLLIIGGSLVFRCFYTGCSDAVQAVRYFHTFSLIGDMALGGFLAYYCSYENRFKNFFVNMNRPMILCLYVTTAACCLFRDSIFQCGIPVIFERFVLASFFGMIILEQNYCVNSFFKMAQFKRVSKLGICTYGLYCLHLLGITFVYKVLGKLHIDQSSVYVSIMATVTSLAIAIGMSILCYRYYEKRFLEIKARFELIPTTSTIQNYKPQPRLTGLKKIIRKRVSDIYK